MLLMTCDHGGCWRAQDHGPWLGVYGIFL